MFNFLLQWESWAVIGIALILCELILPGAVVVFLGVSALVVSSLLLMGWLDTLPATLITWFILSILSTILLRSFFTKYFEGHSSVQNIDEDLDLPGSYAEVIEEIFPHKEGRVRMRGSTWVAKSESHLLPGARVSVIGRVGNDLIVASTFLHHDEDYVER